MASNAEENHDHIATFVQDLDAKDSPLQETFQKAKATNGSIHIIISILSGSQGAQKFYEQHLTPLLSKYGLKEREDYTKHITKSATSVTELAQDTLSPQAQAGKQVVAIILSGDGGIVDLLNGIAPSARTKEYTPPIVAVLPFGTANALAHSSKVASDDVSGLKALCYGTPRPLPSFRVQFSSGARLIFDEGRQRKKLPVLETWRPVHPGAEFANSTETAEVPELFGAVVCSWGFHAAIVADSDTTEFRKHGIDRFKMAAGEALNPSDGGGPHQYAGEVQFRQNGSWTKIPREKHAYVLATAVSNLEQTFQISPDSKPLDGSVRLVHFEPLPGDEIMKVMMQAYDSGKHVLDKVVGYEEIDGLWINFHEEDGNDGQGERWRRVCVDGTIVAVEEAGWIYLEKATRTVLKLIVPPA